MAQQIDENSTWVRSVRAAALSGTLSHAMILSGSRDAMPGARYIAAAHLCTAERGRPCLRCNACRKVMEDIHPDVICVVDPAHVELSVDVIRDMRQDVYIMPNEGRCKVYIFPDCDKLNARDQNTLLKVVEEGPDYGVFLFCSETSYALLPTIRSRCVELRLSGNGDERTETEPKADELCRAFAGRDKTAVTACLVSLERSTRVQLQAVMESISALCAEAVLYAGGKPGRPCATAELLSRQLPGSVLLALTELTTQCAGDCRYNAGVGHLLGVLAAKIDDLL